MWNKYNYVNTMDKIRELDKFLINPDGTKRYNLISYDTETNGLYIHKNTIVGFSLSVDKDKGWYIPILEWVPDLSSKKKKTKKGTKYDIFERGHLKCVWTGKIYPEFVTPQEYEMPEHIPMIIHRWFSGAQLIMHNAPFDVNMTEIATGVNLTDSVFMDTALLSHILNENSLNGLKETAGEYSRDLNFNSYEDAAAERKELGMSVFINGGAVTDKFKPKHIWRADPSPMCKYACADTFLTYGVYEVLIQKLVERFGEKGVKWILEEEVMPVCKEVVMDMKRRGVYLDIPHFEKQAKEVGDYLNLMEDKFIEAIKPHLAGFKPSKSFESEVKQVNIVTKIIELEGLSKPKKYDKKTDTYKETLAKGEVKKVYQEDPHWIWGYILGEDEIKYSSAKMEELKKQIFFEKVGKRYEFNMGSDNHLRWLFCEKLGYDKKKLPQTDSATKDNPIPSMKAEVLEEHMLEEHPWVEYLLIYKKLKKLHSTYILPAIDLNINGWLYMDMKQNGTVSGRFACGGGFNLQTLPNIEKELETLKECNKCYSENVEVEGIIDALCNRKCNDCGHVEKNILRNSIIKQGFIAPPGYKIVNADYSSLEPRCFAYMSGDDKLKEVYWEGLDLYSKVYCDMFDNNNEYSAHPDDVNFLKKKNKAARTETKPIVLGIPYGSRAYQVAIMCNKYKEITDKKTGAVRKVPDEAYGQWVIDTYLNTYASLHDYMEKMEIDCVTKGYVESMYGRRRHFESAPIIYKFLLLKGLSYTDLIDCKPYTLSDKNVNTTSNLGNKMTFNEEELRQICKDLGKEYSTCREKGSWSYIRGLLKNDLNNAKNWPIQSLAGHITNRGMLETTRFFKKNHIDGWVFLQVHDEISCYVKVEQSEFGRKFLKEGMEDNIYAKGIDVPMIADPIVCDNIKDAK